MALWGKTDAAADVPKFARNTKKPDFLNTYTTAKREVIFIDNTEAGLDENIARGFKSPGWYSYYTIERPDGTLHYKTELLVAIQQTAAAAGDGSYSRVTGDAAKTDDAVAADATTTAITISVQPANRTGVATPYTNASAFSVTATGGTGSLLYQWQRQTATGTTWTNITNNGTFAGATTATLGLTSAAKATYDGSKFRVRITAAGGSPVVYSNAASITYA